MSQLRESLVEAMERQSIRPRTLALQAGLGETAVRDIVTGRTRDVKLATVQKLADALGVEFYNLMIPHGSIDPKRSMPITGLIERGSWLDKNYVAFANWRSFTGRGDIELGDDEVRFAFEMADDSADSIFPRGSILDVVFEETPIDGLIGNQGEMAIMRDDRPQLLQRMRSPYVVSQRHDGEGKVELSVWKLEHDGSGALWLVSLSTRPQFSGAHKIADQAGTGPHEWTLPENLELGSVVGAYIPYGVGYITQSL